LWGPPCRQPGAAHRPGQHAAAAGGAAVHCLPPAPASRRAGGGAGQHLSAPDGRAVQGSPAGTGRAQPGWCCSACSPSAPTKPLRPQLVLPRSLRCLHVGSPGPASSWATILPAARRCGPPANSCGCCCPQARQAMRLPAPDARPVELQAEQLAGEPYPWTQHEPQQQQQEAGTSAVAASPAAAVRTVLVADEVGMAGSRAAADALPPGLAARPLACPTCEACAGLAALRLVCQPWAHAPLRCRGTCCLQVEHLPPDAPYEVLWPLANGRIGGLRSLAPHKVGAPGAHLDPVAMVWCHALHMRPHAPPPPPGPRPAPPPPFGPRPRGG
jgi:hypothetical protein